MNCKRALRIEYNDGTPNTRRAEEFDGSGRIILRSTDDNGDGKPERLRVYEYSNLGLLVDLKESDAGGRLLSGAQFSYVSGTLLSEWLTDTDGDMRIDRRRSYSYSSMGVLISETLDLSNDGVLDRSTHYNYDAEGRLVSVERDMDGDGLRDSAWVYVWNEEVGPVRREIFSGDRKFSVEQYTYDASGRLVREEYDGDLDGNAEIVQVREYEIGSGLLLRHEWRQHGLKKVQTYGYDQAGRILTVSLFDEVSGFAVVEEHEWTCP